MFRCFHASTIYALTLLYACGDLDLVEMASWYPDIEMEEMRNAKGYGKERGAGPSSGVRGCIRTRHYTTSYRDTGEIKFCISEYKHDAFQVGV